MTRKRFAASAPVLAAAAAAAPASAPRHARAAPAWRREFLAWFSDVRADVARLVARRRGDSGDFGDVGDFGDAPGDARRGAGAVASPSLADAARAALAAAAALEDGGAAVSAPLPSLSLVADADEVSTAEALREHARAIEARFFHPPRDLRTGDAPGDEPGDEPGDDPGTTARRFLRFGRLGFSRWRRAWTCRSTPTRRRRCAARRGVRGGARGDGIGARPEPPRPAGRPRRRGGYFGQEGA